MTITCKNEECNYDFLLDITDFDIESSKSGNHTTQYIAEGNAICPKCNMEREIKYLYDELDDTGEILSEELV